jgi:UrcA family protein
MKRLIASNKLPRVVTAAILGALAFGCGAVCFAGDNADVPHAVVKIGDLNLSSPDGAATLYSRIHAAAYEVCISFDTDKRDLPDPIGLDACVHNAVRNAVAKVGQPALSAIYNARNRDPLPIRVAATQSR